MRNDNSDLDLPALYKTHLPLLSKAIADLHEAAKIDEVKDIYNKALAMQLYARQAKDLTLEHVAAEIRLRAKRRAGEILTDMEKNTGAKGVGKSVVDADDRTHPPKLSDLGISKDESAHWRKAAAVPEPEFEQELADARERGGLVSVKDMIARHTRNTTPSTHKEANFSDFPSTLWHLEAKITKLYDKSSPEQREGVVTLLENLVERFYRQSESQIDPELT